MSRVDQILEKIEKGEPVDFGRIARAQPIELLKIGQDYTRDAEKRAQEADEMMNKIITGMTSE